jgi:hypothetical protein
MLSNPPFGVTWGGKDGYEKEARKLERTRYQAGMPRVNDGALLFLQTMLAKMAPVAAGRQPHRHHLQRLAAVQWRLRQRARAKSAAGSWSTTGSTPSSCCPTSFSTTRASSPTSGCCVTTSRPATWAA